MTRGKNPRRRPHTMACGYTGEPSPWAVKLAADTKVGEQDLQGWRRTGNNISLSRRSRAKSTVEEPSRRKMTLLFQRTRSQMKNFEASPSRPNGGFEKEVGTEAAVLLMSKYVLFEMAGWLICSSSSKQKLFTDLELKKSN